ncbi:MAG: hypothetical protein HC900_00695 [Methylacidiphilales bacterium]|nr:hypothetical protein [Candidatus Methylacidiphilales bacterium]
MVIGLAAVVERGITIATIPMDYPQPAGSPVAQLPLFGIIRGMPDLQAHEQGGSCQERASKMQFCRIFSEFFSLNQ